MTKHRRIPKHLKRPTTPEEAFDLYAHLSQSMPKDKARATQHVRQSYLASVNRLLDAMMIDEVTETVDPRKAPARGLFSRVRRLFGLPY